MKSSSRSLNSIQNPLGCQDAHRWPSLDVAGMECFLSFSCSSLWWSEEFCICWQLVLRLLSIIIAALKFMLADFAEWCLGSLVRKRLTCSRCVLGLGKRDSWNSPVFWLSMMFACEACSPKLVFTDVNFFSPPPSTQVLSHRKKSLNMHIGLVRAMLCVHHWLGFQVTMLLI